MENDNIKCKIFYVRFIFNFELSFSILIFAFYILEK